MRGNPANPGVVPRCISDIFQSVTHKLILYPMYKRTKFNECEKLNHLDFKKEANLKSTILNSVEDKPFCDLNKLKSRPDGFKSFLKDDEDIHHIVWVSFFELYNEALVDLLSSTSNNNQSNIGSNLKIVRDQQNNFFVNGLNHVYVNSAEEAMKVYRYGIDNLKKHISSTAMNSTSSRSHSVFTLCVITLKKIDDNDYAPIHVNNFSLCDLAGQERSKKALTSGIHFKEASMINKSLLTLKRCIQMIKDRKNSSSQYHIPFNECMLTKVFQPYLTGNGLTFIIVNINPKNENYDETINSLEFSATASQIDIIKNDSSTNSLRDKLKRLTQLWLQSSKCWSTVQQMGISSNSNQASTAYLNSDIGLFKCPSIIETNKLTNKTQDDIIIDSQDILHNQHFDSTLNIEHSITQKVKEMEETIVELELYDSKFVEDLNNRIDELERQIEASQQDQNKAINLECIHNSVVEIYEKHEEEKRKIKDRMNSLMDQRMKMLQEEFDYQLKEQELEIEDLNMKLSCKENEAEMYKRDAEKNSEHILKLTAELNDLKELIKSKEIEFNEKLKGYESHWQSREQQLNDRNLNTELENCLDNLITKVEYEEKLNGLIQENNNLNDQFNLINHLNDNQTNNSKNDQQRTNSTIRNPTSNQNEFSLDQFSIIEFNKSINSDFNQKRSSLKRPFNFDQPSLFVSNIQPIRTEYEPPFKQPFDKTSNQPNLNNKTVDLPSILETSDCQLNSTNLNTNQLQNADKLLEIMVKRNVENELEEMKKKCEEYKNLYEQATKLLDFKDDDIKQLKKEKERMLKEMNRTIKDEGCVSIMSSSHAKMTKLYTSVLNHTAISGFNNTPYKPLAQLQSARKKRTIEEDQPSSDARYLDLIKNGDKSPVTEKKTAKKKKTAVESKRKAKDDAKKDEKTVVKNFEEAEIVDDIDDIAFFVENGTEKKPKRSRIKKVIAY